MHIVVIQSNTALDAFWRYPRWNKPETRIKPYKTNVTNDVFTIFNFAQWVITAECLFYKWYHPVLYTIKYNKRVRQYLIKNYQCVFFNHFINTHTSYLIHGNLFMGIVSTPVKNEKKIRFPGLPKYFLLTII